MSDDILERAKKALIDDDMTYEDYDECISLLIAEVKAKRNLALDMLTKNKDLLDRAMRAEAEVERLRSLNESLMENGNDLRTRCQKAEARIKELEADRIEARAQYLLFMNDNPGCIAWNFDELDETEQDALREQARYMLELEEPWAYIQLREAREQIKRLEAAFLKSETERKFYTTINGMNSEFDWNGYPECPQNGIHKEWFRQQAREALERIKEEREG